MLAFLTIPIILMGIGWIGWRVLQSKMVTCEVCGATSMNTSPACPICGSSQLNAKNSNSSTGKSNNYAPASNATIDIKATDIESEN